MENKNIFQRIAALLQKHDPELAKEAVKLNEQVAPPAEPAKLSEVKSGEKVIVFEGELKVGTAVFEVGADGVQMPLMDGEYPLEDGSTLVCVGGFVTEQKPAEQQAAAAPPVAPQMSKEQVEEIVKHQLAAHIEALTARLTAIEAQGQVWSKLAKAIEETPVEDQSAATQKSWEEMNALERRRAMKNG